MPQLVPTLLQEGISPAAQRQLDAKCSPKPLLPGSVVTPSPRCRHLALYCGSQWGRTCLPVFPLVHLSLAEETLAFAVKVSMCPPSVQILGWGNHLCGWQKVVSVIQSQILPWALHHAALLNMCGLGRSVLPKMPCFLFYFNIDLVSNAPLSSACREFPAEASSRCAGTSESRACPCAPSHTPSRWDAPWLLGITQASWRQHMPFSLTDLSGSIFRGGGKREERERKKPPKSGERCLQTLSEASCDSFPAFSFPGLKDALR